jgi:hypothetical protein
MPKQKRKASRCQGNFLNCANAMESNQSIPAFVCLQSGAGNQRLINFRGPRLRYRRSRRSLGVLAPLDHSGCAPARLGPISAFSRLPTRGEGDTPVVQITNLGRLLSPEINTRVVRSFVASLALGELLRKTIENILLMLSSLLRYRRSRTTSRQQQHFVSLVFRFWQPASRDALELTGIPCFPHPERSVTTPAGSCSD